MADKQISLSHSKRKILMQRLNGLVFFSTIAYAIIDRYLGIDVDAEIYVSFLLFAGINWVLLRNNYLEISKIFGLTAFNTMIFLVASSEPFISGMHLQFVAAGAVALALYGYDQWKMSVLFVSLSLTLDLLVFTTPISFLPWRDIDAELGKVFFVLNTLLAAFVCVYVFLLNSKLNYDAEITLSNNEVKIKKQNDQLVKVNSELDRFVYSASHDLRSPLSSLLGLINLSEMEKNEDMRLEYLGLMRNRVRAMNLFINDIIDYSRNNRKEVIQKKVILLPFLENIVKDLEFMPGWSHIKIELKFDSSIELICDDIRLKVVLNNLVSNAIKYYDHTKQDSWLHISTEIEGDEIKIILTDNGIGIDEELQPKIFEMFYRAHEQSSGSGLGLYIVGETLLKMGGSISVNSKVTEGTTFIVQLPLVVSV